MNKYETKMIQNEPGKVKLDLLQAIYLGYSLFYMRLAIVTGNSSWATERNIALISLIAFVYSAAVLVYNRKQGVRKSIKRVCYMAAIVDAAGFCFFLAYVFFGV